MAVVRTDLTGGVMTLTLDRPEKLNAFTIEMMQELIDAFDVADADDAVRAVVVTGAGRAFCAGADISGGTKGFVDVEKRKVGDGIVRDGGGLLTLRIFDSLKPVIAAVNGAAVGVGATMQLPMDMRLASEDAKFGFVFGRRGIVPEACSSWFLPRVVGISKAMEWSTTGRIFDAQEALSAGLVRSVHKPADLLGAAQELAEEIGANNAPVSVALTRQMMWRMLGADHPMQAHRVDSLAIELRSASADAAEGVRSFTEKRPAVFPDKVSTDLPDIFPDWSAPKWQ
ncbi:MULTISPECIES: crotonase/enoyl-CoA hydratase family protein [unclassified Sulfitobacter]|jgi:enoyl-CoA hydratase/carnithine racemase|uniref:crotonase/enoyl-CoA hydratase family protein n=2 Tax=Sulfitobacter TaxID=60136 RepID=UPI0004E40286|nr:MULTISPECIES: crotonase/enoyl-CoA hydratase family protein [unclassified Sulfitobacter]PTB00541.1 enoyl-CoA hydratase [Sulfitobacter sp. CB-A]ULO20358.1 crotonase/enoyl-CoA hydratase family protein [Sulfitobacter sp. CB2047]